jgi:hypothetical protein
MAWLTGWQYRKKITIQGSSGAGTNYQILLKVGESSGATGADFHLEGLSANFPSGENQGGDLQFTSSDGSTLLDFWVEKVTGTSPNRVAYVWVEVAEDLGSNQDIYCYFGNNSASNASNGSNTWIFFNDGSALNFDQYRNLSGGDVSSEFSVSDGVIVHTKAGTPDYSQAIKNTTLSNLKIRGKVNFGTLQSIEGVGLVARYNGYDQFYLVQAEYYTGYPNSVRWSIQRRNNGGALLAVTNSPSLSANTWYDFEFRLNGSSLEFWVNGSSFLTATDTTFTSGYFGIHGDWNVGTSHQYDNICVGKYVSPEPAFYSAGPLEQFVSGSRRRLLLSTY